MTWFFCFRKRNILLSWTRNLQILYVTILSSLMVTIILYPYSNYSSLFSCVTRVFVRNIISFTLVLNVLATISQLLVIVSLYQSLIYYKTDIFHRNGISLLSCIGVCCFYNRYCNIKPLKNYIDYIIAIPFLLWNRHYLSSN